MRFECRKPNKCTIPRNVTDVFLFAATLCKLCLYLVVHRSRPSSPAPLTFRFFLPIRQIALSQCFCFCLYNRIEIPLFCPVSIRYLLFLAFLWCFWKWIESTMYWHFRLFHTFIRYRTNSNEQLRNDGGKEIDEARGGRKGEATRLRQVKVAFLGQSLVMGIIYIASNINWIALHHKSCQIHSTGMKRCWWEENVCSDGKTSRGCIERVYVAKNANELELTAHFRTINSRTRVYEGKQGWRSNGGYNRQERGKHNQT